MNPYPKKTVSGFTLVELLIVVIILAILAAIVVPQFASSTDDAKESALDSTLANMRAAIDLYYQQHKRTYPGAKTAAASSGCTETSSKATGGDQATFVDQLAWYTDSDGLTCSKKEGNFIYGPYLKRRAMPKNPISGIAAVNVVNDGNLNMSATKTDQFGWKFDTITGKFIANVTGYEQR